MKWISYKWKEWMILTYNYWKKSNFNCPIQITNYFPTLFTIKKEVFGYCWSDNN